MLLDDADDDDAMKYGNGAAAFSSAREAQLRDQICYIEGSKRTYIVFPDSSKRYIRQAIEACLKKGKDAQVIHEWPEDDNVFHGNEQMELCPGELLIFQHSRQKRTIHSLGEIIAAADTFDIDDNALRETCIGSMVEMVARYQDTAEGGLAVIRSLVIELMSLSKRSFLYKKGKYLLKDIESSFQSSVQDILEGDEWDQAECISTRRTAVDAFVECTGELPTAVQKKEDLEKLIEILDNIDKPAAICMFIKSHVLPLPETVLQQIVIPFMRQNETICFIVERCLKDCGYTLENNEWVYGQ